MASIFTYQEEPHRVHSPWSTPGSTTPQIVVASKGESVKRKENVTITRLEPEKHDGPIEYKLHLLLRSRRPFIYSSTSAGTGTWGSVPSADVPHVGARSVSDVSLSKVATQRSMQTRQARLQQLTTQLLWRLQQSSPFHSSSNAKLVLPVLPEATPRLGVPDRPSKLLPGLEESQGALYEIGVADNGILVGLIEEELEECLTNLRAMAASLGCVVDVHRRVVVGNCEYVESAADQENAEIMTGDLWVAEVLVRPDNKTVEIVPSGPIDELVSLSLETALPTKALQEEHAPKSQFRVAILGASASGKSSLLGTLTTCALDNGRGKSRLSLLKHRHEVASGITSSVAQELLGYRINTSSDPIVVNYATGDVSSWPDIHNLADRLVFLSDSPGLPRYAKSTFRALTSWDPSLVVVCIAADEGDGDHHAVSPDVSLVHLDLCIKLRRRFAICITKLDVATKAGLRLVLSKILSLLKASSKTPAVLNSHIKAAARDESDTMSGLGHSIIEEGETMQDLFLKLEDDRDSASIVPILLTSSVTGAGIGKLHALFRSFPLNHDQSPSAAAEERITLFRTDEVFAIPPSKVYSGQARVRFVDSGVVLCGVLETGTIALGDELMLGPFQTENEFEDLSSLHHGRRASSHNSKSPSSSLARTLSGTFSKSLQDRRFTCTNWEPVFARVKVVSLRNLRLPVLSMRTGETGTVGIQLVDEETSTVKSLARARKGMVLLHPNGSTHASSSFVATFQATEFSSAMSPPLILGGHAIAYINSIRAAVKVVAVALDENRSTDSTCAREEVNHDGGENEVFMFDSEDESKGGGHSADTLTASTSQLNITFKFVSTVEFLERGDEIIVVPNASAAGPVTGPIIPGSSLPGLSGFVGRVNDIAP